MDKKHLVIVLVATIFFSASAVTAASMISTDHSHNEEMNHGGGLDQCGGHMNRKTGEYHYHRTPKC